MGYSTISHMATVSSALRNLGLGETLCKDPSQIDEIIKKLVDEFTAEITDKIETNLSSMSFTKLVTIAAVVLSTVIGGTVSTWYDQIISEFWDGKIKGGIASIISSVIAVIPGAELFFQYAAVDSLRENLQHRITLLSLLRRDLNLLVQVLTSYLTLFSGVVYEYDNFDRAISELTKAIKELSLEISRSENTGFSINRNVLKSVGTKIDNSIKYLGVSGPQSGSQLIDSVHKRYNLKTKPPTISEQFNLVYWIKYFEELNAEIINTFKGDEGKQVAIEIAISLFPFFPKFLQLMMLQSKVNEACTNLINKTPTIVNDSLFNPQYMLGVKVSKDILGTSLNTMYDGVIKFFGYDTRKVNEPEFYTNPKTKDKTLQDINSQINIFETSILTMNSMWEFINAAGAPYLSLAKKVDNSLIRTRAEMVSYNNIIKSGSDKIDDYDYFSKKLKWMSDLTLTKGSLNTAISDYAGFQVPVGGTKNLAINGLQIANLLTESNIIYTDIQNYIKYKKIDEEGNSVVEPVEVGYNLSQTALLKLLGNVAIVTMPEKAKNLIAELKAIEFTYKRQYSRDIIEIDKCISYISLLDSSELFKSIKISMEYYLNSLKSIPTMTDIIDNALGGNLSTIAQVAGDTANVADTILGCIGTDTFSLSAALKDLNSYIDNTDFFKSIEKTLTSLKAELQNMLTSILNMSDIITEAAEAAKYITTEQAEIMPDSMTDLTPFIK